MIQTPPKYMIGDVFLANNGSIGVISEVSLNKAQSDPHYCQYAAEEIPGYGLSKNAWWKDSEFKEVLMGPLHKIVSGEITLSLT